MLEGKKAGLLAVLCSLLVLTGCQTADRRAHHYQSAYQSFGSLCLVPQEEHSASLDLLVMQMLRDRGFEPVLIENNEVGHSRKCRAKVSFSVTNRADGETMSLTFTDCYTGENYHVSSHIRQPSDSRLEPGSVLTDRDWVLRRLVDRLFPESPLVRD